MKTTNRFLTAVIAATLSWSAQGSDLAATLNSVPIVNEQQVWVGTGTSYDTDLVKIEGYGIAILSEVVGPGKLQTVGFISHEDETVTTLICRSTTVTNTGINSRRSIQCNNGSGEDIDLGSMTTGEFLSTTDDATVRSTTVRDDGGERVRIVRDKVIDGQIVGYFRENLTRVR